MLAEGSCADLAARRPGAATAFHARLRYRTETSGTARYIAGYQERRYVPSR